jgi:DNA-binding CsgD family transcriptional regulator
MAQLRDRDFRSLNELLPCIYALRERETFGREVISLLQAAVSCDSCSYNEIDLKKGVNGYISHPATPRLADHRQVFNHYIHEHPLLSPERYAGKRLRGAWKLSDLVDRREFVRLGIYNEYFRPLGIEDQIGFALAPPDTQRLRATAVALNRSRRDFSERDRLCLTFLRPHLRQAFANAGQFSRMKGDFALLARGMEVLNRAVVLLDARGAVRYASADARRVLTEACGGAALKNGRIPEDIERWLRERENGSDLRVRTPLVIQAFSAHIVVRSIAGPYGQLLLFESDPPPAPGFAELGLTPREAEVLWWTCCGKTNADIAAILDVSRRTVEKHLERIYPKLGVETRAAATSLVHRMRAAGTSMAGNYGRGDRH